MPSGNPFVFIHLVQHLVTRGSLLLMLGLAGCGGKDSIEQHTSWRTYGGSADQSKYQDLTEITKSNVNRLKVAWFYPSGDDIIYQFNPIVVDSTMYVLAKNNSLVALNARTGSEIWIHANLPGMAGRGITYWESKDRKDRRLLFQINNYLQAIDAQTGKSLLSFGNNGLVDLKEGLGRHPDSLPRVQSGTPGVVFENLLLLGSSPGENYLSGPGHLRAFDVVTGKRVWTFHTIPQPGEFGYDTWPKDAYRYAGGVNTWGEISVDTKRGIAYFPLGSPTYDYWGGDRAGSNLFGNSILALDARTGKRLWHYQVVHHDLWDYDLTAAPQLITVKHKGNMVDAVAVATKHGFLFVFNRETGEPLWPIEERPVPPSDVAGEKAWPTQPYPTVLPPISRQALTTAALEPAGQTPEQLAAWTKLLAPGELSTWKKKLDSARSGIFTPLSLTHQTTAMPGSTGGTNLGNTAADPANGIVYVMSQSYASVYDQLQTRKAMEAAESKVLGQGRPMYSRNCQSCHGSELQGGVGPSLLRLSRRVTLNNFKQLVTGGKGEMPAFPHLDDEKLKNIYTFLTAGGGGAGRDAATPAAVPSGPVVAAGGAPGGLDKRPVASTGGRYGAAYPVADTPSTRYYIEGYGLGYPFLMPPPWSEIMAYDLNTASLRWRVPLGKDNEGKATGVPRGAQRNGMVVTSTGIVFSTARDEKVYAFDAANGKELWAGQLPAGSDALPSMYAINGHQYLVVGATVPPAYWGLEAEARKHEKVPPVKGGYIVFALPE